MEIVVDGQKQQVPVKVAKRFYGQNQGHRGAEGVEKSLKTRRMEAEALDVGPVVHPVGTVWSCAGCDGFECLANISIFAFGGVSDRKLPNGCVLTTLVGTCCARMWRTTIVPHQRTFGARM